ncbi:glycosyltransferase [Neptuniibacter sp. QD37_6]|uniref:glycosyltransferase n=1 Tax=Neptuniibacter sp. QD37_6 TaxID=3398210 RepID=UPI0039F4597C
MKIMHITHTDVTDDSRIEKEIEALLNLDDASLYSFSVKSQNFSQEKLHSDVTYKIIDSKVSRIKRFPRSLKHIAKMLELSFWIVWKGLSIRPKVIHAHDTLVLPAATVLAMILSADLIYDAHELESNKNGQSNFMRLGTKLLEKLCWWRVDAFITVSSSIRDWYFTNFSPKKNAIVLNSPVLSTSGESHLRSRFGISEDSLVFIYIGYLSKGRGIENTLAAFEGYQGARHLVFLGSGDLEPLVKAYSAKNNNIHHHPPVAHDEVVKFARGADVGLCVIENVSLSDYYCLPNKLFEYAFSGLKIIGSDFPEINKVIAEYDLGLVVDGSVESLKAAIFQFESVMDSDDVKDLSGLTWNSQENRLRDLYASL